LDGARLVGHESRNRDCVSVQRGELHFIASVATMHKNHRADVAGAHAVFWQVAGQNHVIQFVNHNCLLRRNGYAVTKRGRCSPASMNHTDRIPAIVPSASVTGPSTMKRFPNGVVSAFAPTGQHLSAQGCDEGATLDTSIKLFINPEGTPKGCANRCPARAATALPMHAPARSAGGEATNPVCVGERHRRRVELLKLFANVLDCGLALPSAAGVLD